MSSTGCNLGMLMAPKLTSCYVCGMLLKYWLSTESVFIGVLVSGGLPWRLMFNIVTGVNTTRSCVEIVLCEACCCDVC